MPSDATAHMAPRCHKRERLYLTRRLIWGPSAFFGFIEVDETYVGGKEKNKHRCKRTKGTQGRNTKTKTPIIGFIQRGGPVKAFVLQNVKMKTVEKFIVENIAIGSQMFIDDFLSYSKINTVYRHKSVIHSIGQYVNGEAHTNSIESFWAILKRGYYGIYHHMSKKHLQRYVDEFVYRFNNKNAQVTQIFLAMLGNISNLKPLKYQKLINTSV